MPEESPKSSSASMVRSMGRNAFGVLVSRLSGVLRDVVIAGYWGGSGAAQAAYHLAFKVPNMFRALFGEGAFSSAMVPAISEKLAQGDRDGAWRIAQRTISLQMLLLAALVVLGSLTSVAILTLLPPDTRLHIRLTFRILPILLPYMLLVCATASFASILNALRVFALPALNQAIFNITQVAAVLVIRCFWRNDDLPALLWFCASVILAGFLQVGMLMELCRRRGFAFRFAPVWKDEDVQNVCRRFLPSLVGAGTGLLNQFVDSLLVASLGALAVGALEYSHRLIYLPIGLLGVTMGNVCLTDMSRCASTGDFDAMAEKMDFSLRLVLFVSLPCAALMMVLATPFAALLFRHGSFSAEALEHCVYALSFYLPALPAFCCLKVATTPHYATKDTRTPMRVALACIVLNFVLNLILMRSLREGGLALATTICSWIQLTALLFLAHRSCIPRWRVSRTLAGAFMMTFAAMAAAFAARAVLTNIPALAVGSPALSGKLTSLLQLAAGGSVGAIVYLLLCLLFRRPEIGEVSAAFLHRRKTT